MAIRRNLNITGREKAALTSSCRSSLAKPQEGGGRRITVREEDTLEGSSRPYVHGRFGLRVLGRSRRGRCWWCSQGTGTGTGHCWPLTHSFSQRRRLQQPQGWLQLLRSSIAAWRGLWWLEVVPVKMLHCGKLSLYWYFHFLEYLSSKGCFRIYCSFEFVKFWNVEFFYFFLIQHLTAMELYRCFSSFRCLGSFFPFDS